MSIIMYYNLEEKIVMLYKLISIYHYTMEDISNINQKKRNRSNEESHTIKKQKGSFNNRRSKRQRRGSKHQKLR